MITTRASIICRARRAASSSRRDRHRRRRAAPRQPCRKLVRRVGLRTAPSTRGRRRCVGAAMDERDRRGGHARARGGAGDRRGREAPRGGGGAAEAAGASSAAGSPMSQDPVLVEVARDDSNVRRPSEAVAEVRSSEVAAVEWKESFMAGWPKTTTTKAPRRSSPTLRCRRRRPPHPHPHPRRARPGRTHRPRRAACPASARRRRPPEASRCLEVFGAKATPTTPTTTAAPAAPAPATPAATVDKAAYWRGRRR